MNLCGGREAYLPLLGNEGLEMNINIPQPTLNHSLKCLYNEISPRRFMASVQRIQRERKISW